MGFTVIGERFKNVLKAANAPQPRGTAIGEPGIGKRQVWISAMSLAGFNDGKLPFLSVSVWTLTGVH